MRGIQKSRWRSITVVICQILIYQAIFIQQLPAQAGLRIFIVQGDGARNVVQQIPPEPIAVRVEEDRRPVAGAMVTFTAPTAGPSGQFANGATTITVPTDRDGVALLDGFHPNAIAGAYRIGVRATLQGQTALANLRQFNVENKKGHGKLITILAIAGAAGAAAAIAKSGGSGTSTAPSITFGDGAVGAPRP
jgi:hypothetical protein